MQLNFFTHKKSYIHFWPSSCFWVNSGSLQPDAILREHVPPKPLSPRRRKNWHWWFTDWTRDLGTQFFLKKVKSLYRFFVYERFFFVSLFPRQPWNNFWKRKLLIYMGSKSDRNKIYVDSLLTHQFPFSPYMHTHKKEEKKMINELYDRILIWIHCRMFLVSDQLAEFTLRQAAYLIVKDEINPVKNYRRLSHFILW